MDRIFLSDWLLRVILTAGIFGLGLFAYWIFNQRTKSNLSKMTGQTPFAKDGRSTILYFTAPECAPCKTIQQPALKKLENALGKDTIQIVQVDATEEPNLAKEWNVLSVPTTFIIDQHGNVKHINHGAAHYEKLLKQLAFEGSI